MFWRVRAKAVTPTNIRAEFKGAGLVLNNLSENFKRIFINISSSSRPIRIPPEQIAMEVTLLKSSLPKVQHYINLTLPLRLRYVILTI